jgi:hypothetical protein
MKNPPAVKLLTKAEAHRSERREVTLKGTAGELGFATHLRRGNTKLYGVEKHRMRAEFAGDYDVRIRRRVACIDIRLALNVDDMPGNLPVSCFANRTYYRIFPMLVPPALNRVVVCFG